MHVVVIGNYRSNNAGDDMYLYLLRLRYPQHTFVDHSDMSVTPDFVIYGGGGVLWEGNRRVDVLHRIVEEHNVPFCVLSVGSGSKSLKNHDKKTFKGAEFITVRDRIALETIGGTMLPDLGWSYKPDVKPKGNKVGVMLRHSSTYKDYDLSKACQDIMRVLGDIGIYDGFLFFSTYGCRLWKQTMWSPGWALASEYDIQYIDLHDTDNFIEHLDYYNQCKLVITMPYHGIVFSCLYGVPFMGWSYERKVTLLAEEMSLMLPTSLQTYPRINRPERLPVKQMQEGAEIHYEMLDQYLNEKETE